MFPGLLILVLSYLATTFVSLEAENMNILQLIVLSANACHFLSFCLTCKQKSYIFATFLLLVNNSLRLFIKLDQLSKTLLKFIRSKDGRTEPVF